MKSKRCRLKFVVLNLDAFNKYLELWHGQFACIVLIFLRYIFICILPHSLFRKRCVFFSFKTRRHSSFCRINDGVWLFMLGVTSISSVYFIDNSHEKKATAKNSNESNYAYYDGIGREQTIIISNVGMNLFY